MTSAKPKLLLACSAGGHLLEMRCLQEAVWDRYDRIWVCLRQADAENLLKDERVQWAYGPTNRNLFNLVRNFRLAARILAEEKPTCIISTGAAIAVSFIVLGRFRDIKTVYIESFARKNDLSLTGKILYRVAGHFFVQAESLARKWPRAKYLGAVL